MTARSAQKSAALLALVVAAASGARAEERHLKESLVLRVENDVGFSDEDYTNGVFVIVRGPDHTDLLVEERARTLLSALFEPLGAPIDHVQPELVAMQLMYTPHFYWSPRIRTGERPFASVLAARPALTFAGRRDELSLGVVVGALGNATQTIAFQSLAHRYISPWSPDPSGWEHQIGDAPYVALTASGAHAFVTLGRGRTRFLSIDLATQAECGTILNHLEGGPRLRVGFFSVDGAGHALSPGDVSALFLGFPDEGFFRDALRGVELSFTTALVYRRVLTNGLVEGTPFSPSPHTVGARTDVARLEGHLVLDVGALHLALGVVTRSAETTLPADKPWHTWGRFEAGFRF